MVIRKSPGVLPGAALSPPADPRHTRRRDTIRVSSGPVSDLRDARSARVQNLTTHKLCGQWGPASGYGARLLSGLRRLAERSSGAKAILAPRQLGDSIARAALVLVLIVAMMGDPQQVAQGAIWRGRVVTGKCRMSRNDWRSSSARFATPVLISTAACKTAKNTSIGRCGTRICARTHRRCIAAHKPASKSGAGFPARRFPNRAQPSPVGLRRFGAMNRPDGRGASHGLSFCLVQPPKCSDSPYKITFSVVRLMSRGVGGACHPRRAGP